MTPQNSNPTKNTKQNTDKIRVAINGFGRIGRQAFKIALERADKIEVVAVNDLADPENLAYLLKHDSAYGPYNKEVSTEKSAGQGATGGGAITIDGQTIPVLNEREPQKLPWKELKVDVVIESTGVFTEKAKAKWHLDAGAKRVVISAPAKDDEDIDHILVGVNDPILEESKNLISSDASCTTNALVPVMDVMHSEIGIERGLLTTIHAYTASQSLVDGPNPKDFRRGRAAAANLVPTTTGAAKAATKIIPELAGKFDGMALRIPIITGSLIDFTFVTKRDTTAEEINEIFRAAAQKPQYQKLLSVTEEPLVSSDIIATPYASIVDLNWTKALGNLVKVLSWYDNEWGYAHTLLDHVERVGNLARA